MNREQIIEIANEWLDGEALKEEECASDTVRTGILMSLREWFWHDEDPPSYDDLVSIYDEIVRISRERRAQRVK